MPENFSEKFAVSFNSPQCGWMSIGFKGGAMEFHTTTAYTPHAYALTEILDGLSLLLESDSPTDEFVIMWSRNPEAFDFYFKRDGRTVRIEIFQYPSFSRAEQERELAFVYQGDVSEICVAFYNTFAHLRADIETDVFEQNWRQPFPHDAFERFEQTLQTAKLAA
ncbi:MAG: hypothetical protein ABI954_12505 [Pyrinomonadaceae bacterium]